ncbi:serine/threonine protein kinase [Colletotrichum musicola]|uniref:Serine/threonine protein kinase n=1 Tax=Colletotrichum musicola TaxID=2175873 RepID=A0A8H6J9Y1_9PEZI|nr:serine/threonine protein kinase [Colletotrichum musicola]
MFFGDDVRGASIDEIADQIIPQEEPCRCCHRKDDGPCTGLRIIFISLILLGKERNIIDLIRSTSPVCDATISLRPGQAQQTQLETDNNQAESQYVGATEIEPPEEDLFYHLQWQMRSPYFTARRQSSDGFPQLYEEISLPWVHLEKQCGDDLLGYSSVHRISIHEHHHDLIGHGNDFALKVLDTNFNPVRIIAIKCFKKEITSRTLHPHITPILAAFEHKTKFYLLLPWARGGNLQQLWVKYPNGFGTPEGLLHLPEHLDQWLVQQCYGIADALAKVHGYSSLIQREDASENSKLHQDIKPENILCFTYEGRLSLSLTDFGNSQELDPDGTVDKARKIGCKTYRPPEYEHEKSKIGRSWDIWCLGCVYLEFITWAIDGWPGVKDFREKRFEEEDDDDVDEDSSIPVKEDAFFRKSKIKGRRKFFRKSRPRVIFELKRTVTSVSDLYAHCG